MPPFLDLENGDAAELEGRVIVYARCVNESDSDPDSDLIAAMFFTTQPADFTEKFGVPEGGLEDLAQRAAEAGASHPDASSGVVPVYAAPLELEFADIQIAPDDVVFAGRFSAMQTCRTAMQLAAHLYMLHYNDQLVSRSGLAVQSADTPASEPQVTYRTMPSGELSKHLQSHYIAPIMHALEDNNTTAAGEIAQDFIRFCGPKGPLTDDSYAVAAVVQSPPGETRTPLLYKYFEKILAITSERFEDAARIRDQIKTLKAGPGPSPG